MYVLELAHEEGRQCRVDRFDEFHSLAAVDPLMIPRRVLVEFACAGRPVSL
jgi:hypothetical protein